MDKFNYILTNKKFNEYLNAITVYETDRKFCHHDITHLLDTARICYILVLENHLDISKDIVYSTALLHDIGRYDEYYHGIPHEQSTNIIVEILKECNYSTSEIELIVSAISEHRTTNDRLLTLSDVIAKADKLSRLCFRCSAKSECYWSDTKKNNILYL